MRRVRYSVAMSLDGFIADSQGGYDWIPSDPDIDFNAMFAQFDTLLVGRGTYETMAAAGREVMPGFSTVVFSKTLSPADHPKVTMIADGAAEYLRALKAKPGKDIWLFGGGVLFRSLVEEGVVDTVEVGVMPVLLGSGIPFLPGAARRIALEFGSQKLYAKSGCMWIEYRVRTLMADDGLEGDE